MEPNDQAPRIVLPLLRTAAFIGVGLLLQSAYLLVDLYVVAGLGEEALAGVSIVGLSSLATNATYQVLCIGAIALTARYTGAADAAAVSRVASVTLLLAVACGLLVLLSGYTAVPYWTDTLSANPATAEHARAFLYAALPSYAAMFPIAVMSSLLRAVGLLRASTLVIAVATLAKCVMTPALVLGLGPLPALGVAGAGWSSSAAILGSLLAMSAAMRAQKRFVWHWPGWAAFQAETGRILRVGIPASAEVGMALLTTLAIQWALRHGTPDIQAGFGAAMRITQILLIPGMAIALALVPISAGHFGAGRYVLQARGLRCALYFTAGMTALLSLLAAFAPSLLLSVVPLPDASTMSSASFQLSLLAATFVPTGVAYVASAHGQAMGSTIPALLAACLRIPTCVIPLVVLSWNQSMPLVTVLGITIASIWLHAAAGWWLLMRVERHRNAQLPGRPSCSSST